MKDLNFPIFNTKTKGIGEKFNLNDPAERKHYFDKKADGSISKLKKYLDDGNTFVAYLIGKKNSGKGTYSKLFMEALGTHKVGHVSVGDVVRDIHSAFKTGEKKNDVLSFIKKNYRGFHSLEEMEGLILGRSTTTLMSSELILTLLKYEISTRPRQALFIDGFPRALDQINYSLFLKELIGYRDDPDFLIFIDVPESVIDARIKTRVICPICKTPRSPKLAPTGNIGYDETKKEFYLICDNPSCNSVRMVPKEGDELGIDPIRERLETDDKIFRRLLELTGIPKIRLRNCIPINTAWDYVEPYEVTPMYEYELDNVTKKIKIIEKPFVVKDEDGVDCISLLPATVTVALLEQTATLLNSQ